MIERERGIFYSRCILYCHSLCQVMVALPLLLLQLWSAAATFQVFLVDFNQRDHPQVYSSVVLRSASVVARCIVWYWHREASQSFLRSTVLQV